ncbi:MAG TPA: hypothetical protein GX012_02070 [Acholeplasma sp.]|jgi:uncharacterized protein YuzE|nr:hypothetical protein [Acholeplasma sp.]
MKKALTLILTIAITFILTTTNTMAITQDSAPYKTYTQGPNGLVLTQTAYEPTGTLVLNTELNNPEDILIKNNYIYIADSGNKRVLKTNYNGEVVLEINNLGNPTGIDVDNEDNIFVADRQLRTIIKFNNLGEEVQRYNRPTEPLFGQNTPYEPIKVVTGPRGILYIVGAGSTNGLIQLNAQGEFIGFYGTNPTTKTFWEVIAGFFGVTYARNIPVSADNLAIDSKGSVFTISKTVDQKIKRFNIASNISLTIENENTLTDITVNEFGNVYSVSQEGIINEYDSEGNLIFEFGALDDGSNVLGKFINPVAIETDPDNNLYILDKGSNEIQILIKTDFTDQIHQGLINYQNGIYDIEEWRETLKMNSFFSIANSSIANALYRDGQYDEALSYFKIAQDRAGYSEAFWQVRYNWLQSYLAIVFLVGILLYITSKALKFADKKYGIYQPIRNFKGKVGNFKIFRESKYLFKILRHPIDTVYNLKRENKSSVLTASIIYLIFGILMLTKAYTTGFVFNYNDLTSLIPLRNVVVLIIVVLLFVVGNYLISSLQSGEGWFKDVYIVVAYALSPILLSIIPTILLSHVLTLNEIFIFNIIEIIAWSWTIILVIVVIKEVHNYTFKELIVNLLLTVFTILMIILIAFLIYLLSYQLIDYIGGLIKEVVLRASS